ncbi:MAG: DUF190 domain-containing protein [Nocardioidaceae bacterium]
MRLQGRAVRLTIYVGESHQWHHRPLYTEIVHRAHRAKMAGAAVFRGVEGYGASSTIHTSRILSLGEDLPIMVVIIDTEQRIHEFLDELDDVIARGVATLEPVQVHRFTDQGSSRGTGA